MLDNDTKALVAFRLKQARECLRSAEENLNSVFLKASANRSYYCIFHSMRAVLALDRFDTKRHGEVIGYFRQHYVKTEIFPKLLSEIIKSAYKNRNQCDYMDFFVISKDDAAAQVKNAKTFLAAVEEYLSRVAPEALTADINFDDDHAAENNDRGGTP